jgi:hypothetical protein
MRSVCPPTAYCRNGSDICSNGPLAARRMTCAGPTQASPPRQEAGLDDTKPAFPALSAPMSPAWVHGSPLVEDMALPKSLISANFALAKAVSRWMSDERGFLQSARSVVRCVLNRYDFTVHLLDGSSGLVE